MNMMQRFSPVKRDVAIVIALRFRCVSENAPACPDEIEVANESTNMALLLCCFHFSLT